MANVVAHGKTLTDQQLAFALALAVNGGDYTQAAVDAGYSAVSARQIGWSLTTLPHVMEVVRREQSKRFARLSGLALDVAEALLRDPGCPPAVRARVAFNVLDRAGFTPPKRAETDDSTGKPLQRMNKQELEQAIGAIGQALAAARQTTLDAAVNAAGEAEVIDIVEVDPT
jgi:hypothetical protein